jgi:hypothetical protein
MTKSKPLTQNALLAIIKNYVRRERLKARLHEACFWETHGWKRSGTVWVSRIEHRVEKLQAKLKRMDENY